MREKGYLHITNKAILEFKIKFNEISEEEFLHLDKNGLNGLRSGSIMNDKGVTFTLDFIHQKDYNPYQNNDHENQKQGHPEEFQGRYYMLNFLINHLKEFWKSCFYGQNELQFNYPYLNEVLKMAFLRYEGLKDLHIFVGYVNDGGFNITIKSGNLNALFTIMKNYYDDVLFKIPEPDGFEHDFLYLISFLIYSVSLY
jgi:hypothetical protein